MGDLARVAGLLDVGLGLRCDGERTAEERQRKREKSESERRTEREREKPKVWYGCGMGVVVVCVDCVTASSRLVLLTTCTGLSFCPSARPSVFCASSVCMSVLVHVSVSWTSSSFSFSPPSAFCSELYSLILCLLFKGLSLLLLLLLLCSQVLVFASASAFVFVLVSPQLSAFHGRRSMCRASRSRDGRTCPD